MAAGRKYWPGQNLPSPEEWNLALGSVLVPAGHPHCNPSTSGYRRPTLHRPRSIQNLHSLKKEGIYKNIQHVLDSFKLKAKRGFQEVSP